MKYMALVWNIVTRVLDVICIFAPFVSSVLWLKFICSMMYSAFMVYYACSAAGRTYYFHVIVVICLLLAAVYLADLNHPAIIPENLLIPATAFFLFPYTGAMEVFGAFMNPYLMVLLFQLLLLAVHCLFRRHSRREMGIIQGKRIIFLYQI
ncbi:MAG: hypothetical protein E7190_10420 [Erysipelotrichaceae bacterium]|nr:hypothetical protein [Erysipelotrichaceae bacterium]